MSAVFTGSSRLPLAAANTGSERDSEYWRARAMALEAVVAELHARMLALAEVLPLPYLPLLEQVAAEIRASAPATDPLRDWEETASFVACDVGTELQSLWARVARDDEGARKQECQAEAQRAQQQARLRDRQTDR